MDHCAILVENHLVYNTVLPTDGSVCHHVLIVLCGCYSCCISCMHTAGLLQLTLPIGMASLK
jgi:hypothetical protein